MTDNNQKNSIDCNELYSPRKKGFHFYVIDRSAVKPKTTKFFLSDKLLKKRNLNIQELTQYIRDCCWRYGIEDGIKVVISYYELD